MQTVNRVAFTNNPRSQERKDAEKKIVAGGGAVAAATTVSSAANAKAITKGVDMYVNNASKAGKGLQFLTGLSQRASKLWSTVHENVKYVRNWCEGIDMKLFKGLGKNVLGYGFGAITLIAGLADIGRTATDTFQKFKD